MTIGSVLSIAAGGMHARATQLAAIASNRANSDTPGYQALHARFTALQGGGVEAEVEAAADREPDITADMTGMIEARIGFAANAAVFETGATLWDMLLQIKRD